jgi:hypothetical protein
MEVMIGNILVFIGKSLLWLWTGVFVVSVVGGVLYYLYNTKYGGYNKVRKEIFEYVKAYKRRCTGANRFEVTVPILQDAFREYETEVINKVWLELVRERVIEQDPQDNAWCIR